MQSTLDSFTHHSFWALVHMAHMYPVSFDETDFDDRESVSNTIEHALQSLVLVARASNVDFDHLLREIRKTVAKMVADAEKDRLGDALSVQAVESCGDIAVTVKDPAAPVPTGRADTR